MLPTINLQLTEPTRFDPGANGFAPAGADEPTAIFADVLALKGPGRPAAGDSLPPAGNPLPLLPEAVGPDPELTADIVLEGGEAGSRDPQDATPVIVPELAPTSIVAPQDVVEVTLDLEPAEGDSPGVRPAQELPVLREIALPIETPAGKEPRPATPPGPVLPTPGLDSADTRSTEHAPSAALRRDASPQTQGDPSARPTFAVAVPLVPADAEAGLPRGTTAELPAPATARAVDVATARTAEPRAAGPADSATAASDAPKPLIEPAGHSSQLNTHAAETNAQSTAAIADGVPAPGVTDVAPLARTAMESPSSRPPQAIAQPIDIPVQQPDWDRAVSERIVMMAHNKLHHAEIRLTPAELGPLRVQVTMDDGAANVSFHAHHAITRDALEQALPRLREMFAENGLSLGQTSVGHEGAAGGNDSGSAGLAAAAGDASELLVDDVEVGAEVVRTRVESGLVDTFV